MEKLLDITENQIKIVEKPQVKQKMRHENLKNPLSKTEICSKYKCKN
jgi:hypothetical protein